MALTAAQCAQKALNIAKPIQDALNNNTGLNSRQAVHDLAAAVILLAEGVLASAPASSGESTRYGTNVSTTTVATTRQ